MNNSILSFCVSVMLALSSCLVFAQEKTLSYYYQHENDILPDAQAAFQRGNYERTIELCKWNYIILGDNTADSLRERAERCSQLYNEMVSLMTNGKREEAGEIAIALLEVNSDDPAAKNLIETIELLKKQEQIKQQELIQYQESANPLDSLAVLEPTTLDSAVTLIPVREDIIVEETKPQQDISDDVITIPSKPSKNSRFSVTLDAGFDNSAIASGLTIKEWTREKGLLNLGFTMGAQHKNGVFVGVGASIDFSSQDRITIAHEFFLYRYAFAQDKVFSPYIEAQVGIAQLTDGVSIADIVRKRGAQASGAFGFRVRIGKNVSILACIKVPFSAYKNTKHLDWDRKYWAIMPVIGVAF